LLGERDPLLLGEWKVDWGDDRVPRPLLEALFLGDDKALII